MTPEEKRIAIAKSLGWKTRYSESAEDDVIQSPDNKIYFSWTHKNGYKRKRKLNFLDVIPDYLNDLNSMHEIEKKLIEDNKYFSNEDGYGGTNYIDRLINICGNYEKAYHANSRERADAYLKLIGKL